MIRIGSTLACIALLSATACGPGSESGTPGAGGAREAGSEADLPAMESGGAGSEGRAHVTRTDSAQERGGERERAAEAGQESTEREAGGSAYPDPGHAWIVFGDDTVRAEVARTPEQRSRGLMYRESLPENGGMLFLYGEEGVRSFWMQNTLIPLDIAFLDSSLRIVDIQSMEPGTTDMHESRTPAMFALEVRQGWFEAHGIGVGDRAEVVFGAR